MIKLKQEFYTSKYKINKRMFTINIYLKLIGTSENCFRKARKSKADVSYDHTYNAAIIIVSTYFPI